MPERVLDVLERQRVTNAVLVPTMLQMLTARARRRRARLLGAALDRVRRVADHDAGAEGGAAHVRLLALRHLRADRESTGGVVQLEPADHDPDGPREHLLRSRPAGRSRGWSCGSSTRPPARSRGPGEIGEVWLRAPNVMPGYFNRPAGDRGRADRRTAGCAPATAATSTTRATSSSPTGSRT